MPHVTLYQEKIACLKCIVTAAIDESGMLLIEGYNRDTLIEKPDENGDYEYSLKLTAEAIKKVKHQLGVESDEALLACMQQQLGGNKASFFLFKNFLEQEAIEYYFSSSH